MERKKKSAIEIPDIRTKRRRALIGLTIALLLLASAVAVCLWLHHVMFRSNPRLVFRELHVSSSGYWNQRDEELIRTLGLKRNSNIFDLDLGKLRRQLRSVPSIADARVQRILPDTLMVEVSERMPRAIINYPRSRWVIDEEAVVMERTRSMANSIVLPTITGVAHTRLKGGDRLPELQPALDVINAVVRSYPDMEILMVSVSNSEQLDFYIRYRNGKTYRVLMPAKNRGVEYMLNALQSAIIQAYQKGEERTTINLSFDGLAVIN